MSEFAEWDSFYVIVGSAAGALIGLQFVVMTLIAERPPKHVADAGPAFAMPTIIHFSVVLLLSALLRAPWLTVAPIAALWGLIGLGGVVYTLIVVWRMKKQPVYAPVFEDWLCHIAMPLLAYVLFTLSPFAVHTHSREALFAVGGGTLLLLFAGIHNAWDAVAYHVLVNKNEPTAEPRRKLMTTDRMIVSVVGATSSVGLRVIYAAVGLLSSATAPAIAAALMVLAAFTAGCGARSAHGGRGPLGPSSSAAHPFALVDATVIDGTGAPPRPHQTLVVREGRIAELGSSASVKVPSGVEAIDARGLFVTPGLWDSHVHLTDAGETVMPLFVAAGVTGVRDMGGDIARVDAMRDHAASGAVVGPRVVRPGPFLDGPKPGAPDRLTLRSATDVPAALDSVVRLGADFVKVHNLVPPDAYFAVLHEARARGLAVFGHIPRGISARQASDSGQRGIEHTESILESMLFDPDRPAHSGEEALARMTDAEAAELYARFARNGTCVDPTLIEFRAASAYEGDSAAEHDPRQLSVPRQLRAFWNRYFPRPDSVPEARRTLLRRALATYQRAVGMMHHAHVGILAGTDLGARNVFPGSSLHDELALLTASGLSPTEALTAATRDAARVAGVSDSVGTVERGKAADLLLLDADPTLDIGNLHRARAVVLRGRLFSRAELDALVRVTAQDSSP